MAAKRGKSQARRNASARQGLPGWAWLVLGILLALGAVLLAPKFMKSETGDGFFRPRPNPDAQPAAEATAGEDEALVPEDIDATAATGKAPAADAAGPRERDYDFYTLLPGEEVALSDAQLAAAAREEAARKARADAAAAKPQAAAAPAAATTAQAEARPRPLSEDGGNTPDAAAAATPPAPPKATVQTATGTVPIARTVPPTADSPYILQAGAFGAAGDAEEVKARIALLGLNARVESADIGGKTVYRVRMGPYGTAAELAAAKGKLGSGGLPALAIKAK